MTMETTLAQSVRGRLITAEEQELPVRAAFRYSSADPLAVHVDFPPTASLDGTAVTWTFARALLEEGLSAPAGSGDVRLRPCGQARTIMEFHSPYGLALVEFDTPDLDRFLLRSHAVVGAGQEDVGEAVERSLSSLFDGV